MKNTPPATYTTAYNELKRRYARIAVRSLLPPPVEEPTPLHVEQLRQEFEFIGWARTDCKAPAPAGIAASAIEQVLAISGRMARAKWISLHRAAVFAR